MNEQNTPILDESSILDELRDLGVGVNQIKSRIADLVTTLDSKMQRVRQLHQLYNTRSRMVASVAGGLMKENPKKPKKDRRHENNPIKNINIGVNLSYRHSKAQGYDALDALERATTSIVKTAIGNGLHSKKCSCGGRTDNCVETVETKVLVTDADSLPEVVQQKLRQCFQNYENENIPKPGYVSWAEGTEMENGKKKKSKKKGETLTA